jgi:hypothetical protein
MRKLAHVTVQTWRGWDPNNLFGGWCSALGGFKPLIGVIGLVLGAWLILPCLVPLVPIARPLVVYQDHHGGHYRKKNSHPCNDATEIQTPRSG